MQAPELKSIEAALARLMPPAMSEQGRISIESMIDELAGEAAPVKPVGIGFVKAITGIAALVALVAAVTLFRDETAPALATTDPETSPAILELVGESDRIESLEDEGWFADPDGGAMHAVRIRMIEENSLRDPETGIVMQIREPREEMLLMPVSAF
jgi:hypothetical protein